MRVYLLKKKKTERWTSETQPSSAQSVYVLSYICIEMERIFNGEKTEHNTESKGAGGWPYYNSIVRNNVKNS